VTLSAQRRAWAWASALGFATAIVALLVLRREGNDPGIGPADVVGTLLVAAAAIHVSLPSGIVPGSRFARAFGWFSALMFFWALAETAHVCGRNEPTCQTKGHPLRPFIVWAIVSIPWGALAYRRAKRNL
jgi:hypothetical protein